MIRVLVADDQPLVADAHGRLVERVPGFVCVAQAHDGQAALERVSRGDVDLVLLDLAMPVLDGFEVLRALGGAPGAPDVIVVSAARHLDAVRECVRTGAVHYLVKPFTFQALRQKLEHYASYRALASRDGEVVDQDEIDATLAVLRDAGDSVLPKGMSRETLAAVRAALRAVPEGAGSRALAEDVGAARVTVRRYLEHLVSTGSCERVPRYGRTGRPEVVYRLRAAGENPLTRVAAADGQGRLDI